MKNLIIAGPYNQPVKEKLIKNFSSQYNLAFVTTQEGLLQVPDADYMIIRTFRIGQNELDAMPKLKLIMRWGAGYDTIDIKAAGAHGTVVSTMYGVNAPAVAEQALLLMLAVNRNLLITDKAIRKGEWPKVEIEKISYILLDKKVGIIGCGNIGKRVAGFAKALGGIVQYYDIKHLSTDEEKKLDIKYVSLEELLCTSDVITFHVPLDDSTKYILNKDTIALMKRNAIVINTSRGGIIKEKDLYDALVEKRIAGAGLDVFEVEPGVSGSNPFVDLPNVALSCHVGGNTADIVEIIADKIPERINAFDQGKLDPSLIVNTEYLTK